MNSNDVHLCLVRILKTNERIVLILHSSLLSQLKSHADFVLNLSFGIDKDFDIDFIFSDKNYTIRPLYQYIEKYSSIKMPTYTEYEITKWLINYFIRSNDLFSKVSVDTDKILY